MLLIVMLGYIAGFGIIFLYPIAQNIGECGVTEEESDGFA